MASTIKKASVAGSRKMDLAAWTAASHALVWPAQSCCDPVVSKMHMSKERMEAMALQIICRADSPMPIGLGHAQTPGHLSSAINLHATSGARSDGLRYSVHI